MGDRNRGRHRKVRRAAGCVVYTGTPDQRRYLLIRDPYERWTLPKGHLEGAEDDQAAAVREVQEETGISGELGPQIGTIIYTFFHHGQAIEKRVTFFLMHVDGSTEATPQTSEGISEADAARNARYGLILFAVYSLLYGTFMALTAFAPQVMEIVVLGGLNLAVLYGLGLIVAAFLLALVYAWLCRAPATPRDAPSAESSSSDAEGGP